MSNTKDIHFSKDFDYRNEQSDYEFKVKSRGFGGGAETTSTIFVTVGKAAGAKPEFTQVVR